MPAIQAASSPTNSSHLQFPNGYWTGAAWSAFAGFAAIPAFQGIGIIGKYGETLKVRKEGEHNVDNGHITV
ncbi:hypothetical protein CPB85DRAFT_1428065 [Mucidula mucida]|nr:hypothetical protein CPB85DRAFT_1428065 [Mucidula mucida]